MTTAIRRYCTYILSTFVPLNTIRTGSGLFLFLKQFEISVCLTLFNVSM